MDSPGAQFAAALYRIEPGCYFEGAGPCEGPIQAHHLIPRAALRDAQISYRILGLHPLFVSTPLDVLIADPRNGVRVCVRHHHRAGQLFQRIHRDALPLRFFEFVGFYKIDALADRFYPLPLTRSQPHGGHVDTPGYPRARAG